MAEVMLFLHFDTQTALDALEDSLPPLAEVDRAGVLRLTRADAAALETRRAAWLAHLGRRIGRPMALRQASAERGGS